MDEYRRIEEVEILQGSSNLWIGFRDSTDAQFGCHWRQRKNPTLTSFQRLLKVVNAMCDVQLVPDGYSFFVVAKRKEGLK